MSNLVPSRELRELDRLKGEMDRLFERFLDWQPLRRSLKADEWMPAVDVSETTRDIIVHAEIPGMDPNEIDVSIKGNVLTLSGERKHMHEEKEEKYHRLESRYGIFRRLIELPADVDASHVSAKYKRGVLKIRLPKTKKQLVKKVAIKIG